MGFPKMAKRRSFVRRRRDRAFVPKFPEHLEQRQLLAINLTMLSVPAATEARSTGVEALASFSFSTGALGDYSAVINWGDGTSSAAIIQPGAAGVGSVTGSHVYAETGSDTLSVTVTGDTASASGTTPVTVLDQVPVTEPDTYAISHDRVLSAASTVANSGIPGVLVNDVDPEGKTITATVVQSVQHGGLSFNSNGTFTYTPTAHFVGTDTFTYRASNATVSSAPTTVSIVVSNATPSAVNDLYTTAHGKALSITTTSGGVLGNDTDADVDTLTAAVVALPQHGTLTLNSNGTPTYTPTAGFVGTDTFTYQASDGILTSNVATATVQVTESAPIDSNASFTFAHGTALSNSVHATDADTDTLTYSVVSQPACTARSTLNSSTGAFTYTPTAGFYGTRIAPPSRPMTGRLYGNVATVLLGVTEVAAPWQTMDSYTTAHGLTLTTTAGGFGNTAPVLYNDTDADHDTMTASVVAQPLHGTLTFSSNGTFTYTPAAGFSGTDSFTYQVSDGILTSSVATATIAVTESIPVAAAYSLSVLHDRPLNNSVHATDADNDTLTYSAITQPTHGTLTLSSNGSFTYTPTAHYSGPDSFTYQANDGLFNSNAATVMIGVNESAPIANNDSYTISHGQTLSAPYTVNYGYPYIAGVLANDTDAEGDTLTGTVVTQPAHGTLTFSSNGTFTYTPTAGFVGIDSFTYKANDGVLNSNVATATISVTGVGTGGE